MWRLGVCECERRGRREWREKARKRGCAWGCVCGNVRGEGGEGEQRESQETWVCVGLCVWECEEREEREWRERVPGNVSVRGVVCVGM